MKLITILKSLILTEQKVGSIINNNDKLLIYTTKHQIEDRCGNHDFYENNVEDRLLRGNWFCGVNNKIIVNSINNNINKILNFIINNPNNPPIIFVDEFGIGSEYIEYLISFEKFKPIPNAKYNVYKLTIITSAFSNDGLWIKKFGAKQQNKRINLYEHFNLKNIKIFFLKNNKELEL